MKNTLKIQFCLVLHEFAVIILKAESYQNSMKVLFIQTIKLFISFAYKLIYFIFSAISELKKKFHCIYSSVM